MGARNRASFAAGVLSCSLGAHCAASPATVDAGGSGPGSSGLSSRAAASGTAGGSAESTGSGSSTSSGNGVPSSGSGADASAAPDSPGRDAGSDAGPTGSGESDAAAASSGGGNCGTRTGKRGKTIRNLMVGGTSRSYVAYLPMSANPKTPMPFVYVFHGATQTGSYLYDATQYSMLADSDGIAVVFPDGQNTSSATSSGTLDPWNVSDNGAAVCGAGSLANNANAVDFAFVDAIKTDMLQDQCLDVKHTFATGFSMGGYFSHHIACDRPDFTAAAPHSGGTLADLSSCKTTHMPIIIFHGTSDGLIAPGCDDPNSQAQSGFPPSATLWAQKNGCKTTYQTIAEMGTTSGDNGQCYLYDGCPAGAQVELCTFTNLQHAWAGAPTCQGCIGSGTGYPSATQLEWAFFKKYAW
ncbi:MAG TPA: PHB depolymerase family esterase [Polyangiaceae bacterium]|nr:PHB depolymerase family esterase [Polyangiaceae bacterium]